MMGLNEKSLIENFDERNIEQIRAVIEQEKVNGPRVEKAYTMVQMNSPCEIEVTEQSRKICVNALLK